jgi:hypothetical protein
LCTSGIDYTVVTSRITVVNSPSKNDGNRRKAPVRVWTYANLFGTLTSLQGAIPMMDEQERIDLVNIEDG